MQKKLSILLAALITLSMLAGYVPVRASLGNINVNSKTAPSPPTTIKLGENVSLYFGNVTWSGGTIDLYLSTNGYAALNYTTDTRYGPTFRVSDLKNMTYSKQISTDALKYTVGRNWINGTVARALAVPGGDYYIKAFDGITSAVAVTDNFITIKASFEVVPTSGPGQASITLKGYALPANGYANLSYNMGVGWVVIKNLHRADAKGSFTYAMLAPDFKKGLPAGLQPETSDPITFRMIVNSTGQTETAIFAEWERGLKQVKGKTGVLAGANQLYGNTTNFGLSVNVTVLGSLIIAGNRFHPGTATILWDKATALGTTTVNGTGWFNTTVTVPITSIGSHNVTIDEGKAIFYFWVNVVPTLILTPDKGPVGTHVVADGYGFPAKGKPAAANVYNVTLTWDYVDGCTPIPKVLLYVLTDTNGHFTTAFDVPHTVGGAHTVTAVANSTPPTTATATFTVKAALLMVPTSFYNNGTVVTINATGLAYHQAYDLNLDNHKDFLVAGNCIGDFTMKFVAAAGFDAGVHVATMYKTNGTGFNPEYEGHVLFTVNSVERDVLVDKLDEALENLDEIKESLGDLTDLVEDESTQIDTVKNAILDAIEEARGDVSALAGQLSAIETLASTAAQQASSAAASSSTAASNASDAKTAAQGAQSATSGISMAVYGAVVLSLIAALASIVAVITLQRKVAG